MNRKTFFDMHNTKQLLAAVVALVMAACAGDEAVDANLVVKPAPEAQPVPILFGSASSGLTRADFTGAVAADMLGRQFVVCGYKGAATATPGTIVFDNYAVQYKENTANTTESNTSNWEYAGIERIKHAADKGITRQALKYWDYTEPQYDFIAWSTGSSTAVYEADAQLADGQVRVSAITPDHAAAGAYTFEGRAADLQECYIADIVTVKKAGYGNTVTLKFRSLGTKVRIGIYETIPGYSVRDVQFYSAPASDDAQGAYARLFTTTANTIYTAGTYTVYYPTVDADNDNANNVAHVEFAGTGDQTTTVEWPGMNYTGAEDGEKTAGNVYVGRSSTTATFAGSADDNYYLTFLPNEAGTNLNLRVNYTLESTDGSGETLVVKGATAQVPLVYAQWKPGYAYTYLFKISDKTNGHTGVYDPTNPDDPTVNPDPTGLYPITFDAVVVNTEDNTQETITTVSAPSITTYQKGSNVVNSNEYTTAGDIYVTVNDGNSDATPDLANGTLQTLTGKAALYTVAAGTTEAEVADALAMPDEANSTASVVKGRNGLELTLQSSLELTSQVEYGADGVAIALGTDQAARFTPASATTYAFVYTKADGIYAVKVIKVQ